MGHSRHLVINGCFISLHASWEDSFYFCSYTISIKIIRATVNIVYYLARVYTTRPSDAVVGKLTSRTAIDCVPSGHLNIMSSSVCKWYMVAQCTVRPTWAICIYHSLRIVNKYISASVAMRQSKHWKGVRNTGKYFVTRSSWTKHMVAFVERFLA